MKLTIQTTTLNSSKRMVVMSDIHGELELFKKALAHVNYSDEDILIIVGDVCEKGSNSLGLVRYLIELKKTHEVYVLMGNCDTLYEDIYTDEGSSNEEVKQYMLYRKHTILNEMCEECGIEVNEQIDMEAMKKKLRECYSDEFSFLRDLPIILNTDNYIFVHAGIESEVLRENDAVQCLTRGSFLTTDKNFAKCVVVGHWPCGNYDRVINNNGIRVDWDKNIIAIDGGNQIKETGQLNILIIDRGELSFDFVDRFSKIKALEEQCEGTEKMNLCFPYTELEIIEEGQEESLCLLKTFDSKRMIANREIYTYRGKTYCQDTCVGDLEIGIGEILALIRMSEQGLLVKKANGDIGWYYGKYEECGE